MTFEEMKNLKIGNKLFYRRRDSSDSLETGIVFVVNQSETPWEGHGYKGWVFFQYENKSLRHKMNGCFGKVLNSESARLLFFLQTETNIKTETKLIDERYCNCDGKKELRYIGVSITYNFCIKCKLESK